MSKKFKGGRYEGVLLMMFKEGCDWLPGWNRSGNSTSINIAGGTANTFNLPNMELEEFSGYAQGEIRESGTTVTFPDTFTATFDDPSGKIAAIAKNAQQETKVVAAGSQVDLLRKAPAPGDYVSLPMYHTGITSLVVVRKAGDTASAWVTATTYAVGDYVVPTVANGHFYKATVAGTSDATEPGTWPTDGTTVTDGTVTWQDMGTIEAALNVDYVLTSSAFGAYKIAENSRIEYNEELLNSYDYAARTFEKNLPASKVDTYAAVRFYGENYMTGEKMARQFHYCHLVGTSEDVLSMENNMTWTVTFTIKKPPADHPELPDDYVEGQKQIELLWEDACQ